MMRGLVAVLASGLVFVGSCSNEPPNRARAAPESKERPEESPGQITADSGGTPDGVECSHPGAGKPLGGDRCECTTSRAVAGEWSTKRTCREGATCTTRDKEESDILTQNGTTIRADRGDSYSITGTLCGDVLIWSGGPKDGLNPECGQLRFTDDSHYVSDSCFVASGECLRTHGTGCPSQKGQCTGTGAKKPETAANIQKVVCD